MACDFFSVMSEMKYDAIKQAKDGGKGMEKEMTREVSSMKLEEVSWRHKWTINGCVEANVFGEIKT